LAKPDKPIPKIKSAYMNQYDAQQERARRRKKQLWRRLVVVSMAFLVVFGVMITYHLKQRAQYSEIEQEYEELNDKMVGLEKQKDSLLEEIDLLNDEEYILDIARTNYFLSKKGELIFQTDDQDERTY